MTDRPDITPPYRKKSVSEKLGLTKVNPVSDFMQIDKFDGIYSFLSLEASTKIVFSNFEFPSALHALHFVRFEHKIRMLSNIKHEDGNSKDASLKDIYCYSGEDKRQVPPEVIKLVYDISTLSPQEIYSLKLIESKFWFDNRDDWTEKILRDKYRRNDEFRKSLVDTGDRSIVYITPYDGYLGKYGNSGDNRLGKLSELIRLDTKNYTEIENWLKLCPGVHHKAADWSKIDIEVEYYLEQDSYMPINLSKKPYYLIGRLPTCDISRTHPLVSRIHGAIFIDKINGKFQIISFNSNISIELNDKGKIEPNYPYPLQDKAFFTFGSAKKIYHIQLDNELLINNLENEQKEIEKQLSITKYSVADEIEKIIKGSKDIIVLNVAYKTTRQDLYDFFKTCGRIDRINIPHHDKNKKQYDEDEKIEKGIAFIRFTKEIYAASAIEMDGMSLNDKRPMKNESRGYNRDYKHDRWKRERSPS